MKLATTLMSLVVGCIVLIFTSLMLKAGLPSWLAQFSILTIILAVTGVALVVVAMRLWRSNPDTGIIVGVVMGMGAIQLSVLLSVFLFIAYQILQAVGQTGG